MLKFTHDDDLGFFTKQLDASFPLKKLYGTTNQDRF